VETYGRRARVAFAASLAEDARRRDFTINALYARPDGTVIDPLGGLPDLQARQVCFIENPEARIKEDYLRILRFFRFHAWYGRGEPDPEGVAACAALADGVERLSRERIGAEMLKLLAAPDPAPAAALMQASGVLAHVLPGADTGCLAPLIDLEGKLGARPEPIRRLAALGGDEVAERLRLSKAQARRRARLIELAATGMTPAELGYREGEEMGRDIVLLRAALGGGSATEQDLDDLALGAGAEFPISARDLVTRYQGPALGQKLAELERVWIESGFALDREALLARDARADRGD